MKKKSVSTNENLDIESSPQKFLGKPDKNGFSHLAKILAGTPYTETFKLLMPLHYQACEKKDFTELLTHLFNLIEEIIYLKSREEPSQQKTHTNTYLKEYGKYLNILFPYLTEENFAIYFSKKEKKSINSIENIENQLNSCKDNIDNFLTKYKETTFIRKFNALKFLSKENASAQGFNDDWMKIIKDLKGANEWLKLIAEADLNPHDPEYLYKTTSCANVELVKFLLQCGVVPDSKLFSSDSDNFIREPNSLEKISSVIFRAPQEGTNKKYLYLSFTPTKMVAVIFEKSEGITQDAYGTYRFRKTSVEEVEFTPNYPKLMENLQKIIQQYIDWYQENGHLLGLLKYNNWQNIPVRSLMSQDAKKSVETEYLGSLKADQVEQKRAAQIFTDACMATSLLEIMGHQGVENILSKALGVAASVRNFGPINSIFGKIPTTFLFGWIQYGGSKFIAAAQKGLISHNIELEEDETEPNQVIEGRKILSFNPKQFSSLKLTS